MSLVACVGMQFGAGITRTLDCPKQMVGRVIGKGGETIKALQRNFGANIQIDQSLDPMKITVSGQPPAVDAAMAAVSEIVAGGNPYIGGPGGPDASAAYGKSLVCGLRVAGVARSAGGARACPAVFGRVWQYCCKKTRAWGCLGHP